MSYTRPKGTSDIYGSQVYAWQYVEKIIREMCADFCYEEIRTPVFEHTELFKRGVGETTDIVQKEMFSFNDAGGRGLTLRPEGTAGAVRALVENNIHGAGLPVKLYYIMPNFRAEKPQKGRARQHVQFGAEFFGASGPECDAEIISVVFELLRRLGVKGTELRINSIGNAASREKYNAALTEFLSGNIDKLCATCRERFVKNPLRALDCKVESCKGVMSDAPTPLGVMDTDCLGHFENVKKLLDAMGIAYTVDEKLVRGLDYYTRTVFEFVSGDLGAQSSLCGGGRYDNLVKGLGGPDMAAVGFGLGIERLLIVMEEQGIIPDVKPRVTAFIGHSGDEGAAAAFNLVYKLRQNAISAECDVMGRSVKAQMKYADKINARYSAVIGGDELASGTIKIKDMDTGGQSAVSLDDIIDFF